MGDERSEEVMPERDKDQDLNNEFSKDMLEKIMKGMDDHLIVNHFIIGLNRLVHDTGLTIDYNNVSKVLSLTDSKTGEVKGSLNWQSGHWVLDNSQDKPDCTDCDDYPCSSYYGPPVDGPSYCPGKTVKDKSSSHCLNCGDFSFDCHDCENK
jgi:hypothetical protein